MNIQRTVLISIIITGICLALMPAASAYTATLVSPASESTALHSGDVIKIQVNSLADGNHFTYKLTSADMVTPGNSVNLPSVNMPFDFKDGLSDTTLTTTGVTSPTFTVTKDGGSQMSKSGTTVNTQYNIKTGNYVVSVTGTKTGSTVGIDYNVTGVANSPGADPVLSFTLSDVTSGHLTIDILDGSTSVLSKTFTITPSPTPTPTPSHNGDTSSSSSPSSVAALAAGPVALLAPPGISATSATLQSNTEGQVLANYAIETDPAAGFSSTVNINTGTMVVSAAGKPVSEISVTPLASSKVSEATAAGAGGVYSFSGLSVECEPSGTQFSHGTAGISFALTPAQWADALGKVNGNTAAMTIQFYDTGSKSWVSVPTVVDTITHTVTAQVSHFSLYALFYKSGTTTSPVSQQITGTATASSPVTAATPAPVTSIAGKPTNAQLAPPTATQSPGLPGIVVIGIVGFVGFFAARKMK